MGEEEAFESRKMEKRIKLKSKEGKKNEDHDIVMHEVKDIGGDKGIEHAHAFEKDEIVEKNKRKRKDKEKKENKKVEGVEDVDLEKKHASKGELIGLHGEDSIGGAIRNVERKKKKKREKRKNKNGVSENANGEDSIEDAVNNVERMKKKKEKLMNKNGSNDNVNGKNSIGDEINNVERKKKKKEKTKNKNGSSDNANGKDNIGDAINNVERKKKKKEKRKNKNEASNDAQFEVRIAEEVEVNEVRESPEEKSVSKTKSKKKSKTEKRRKEIGNHNDAVEKVEKAKRKRQKEQDEGKNKMAQSNKKVRFASEVEVFHLPEERSNTGNNKEEEEEDNLFRWNNKGDNLVRGKRFTKEEDEIVKDAVLKYVELRDLGEDGLDMVLNSKGHKELRGCWKEIGSAIPYRPYTAVYGRAQVLFKRSDKRKWTQEEFEIILNHQKYHGNNWKSVAEEIGTHHWHVKDAWRRIRLPNLKKGNWSQQEYQKLFDLVNTDLQLKVAESEEKNTKYGMLRDNIAWTAISYQVETRSQAACCLKWYKQLTSPMVAQGVWADADDYLMIGRLYSVDASCIEDVDWDELLDDRSGELCRKRWNQMSMHIGKNGLKSFAEQVEVLAQRYCPHLFDAREEWDNKPRVV